MLLLFLSDFVANCRLNKQASPFLLQKEQQRSIRLEFPNIITKGKQQIDKYRNDMERC